MKKVLWTAMMTAATTLGAMLGMKVVERAWRGVTHEPPPGTPGWARLLVALPVSKAVKTVGSNGSGRGPKK